MTFCSSSTARAGEPGVDDHGAVVPEKTSTLFLMPQGNATRWIAGVSVGDVEADRRGRPPFDSSQRDQLQARPTRRPGRPACPSAGRPRSRRRPWRAGTRRPRAGRWRRPGAAASARRAAAALTACGSASTSTRSRARLPVAAAWKMVCVLTGGGPR